MRNKTKKSKAQNQPEYSDQQMKDFFIKASSPVIKVAEMPAFKPLLIKSSSSMGSAPSITMKPVNFTKKLKRLKNKIESSVIPILDTPNPNYGNVINKPFNLQEELEFIKKAKSMSKAFDPPTYYSEKQKLMKPKTYKQNSWLEHVKKCREENPSYTYKQALQKCKETYTKK